MGRKIRIGSRASRLAVVQSELVMAEIRKILPEADLELVTMKTTGDKILHKTLDKIGGKGLFLKELDAALLNGQVDICVHSLKDVPVTENSALPIGAYSVRELPADVLVFPKGTSHWDPALPVGCASARRKMQFQQLYPEAVIQPVRGNVLTRLEKLDSGEYGALILAEAGLIQTRAGEYADLLARLNSPDGALCAKTERQLASLLGGDCSAPVGCHAQLHGTDMTLYGFSGIGGVSRYGSVQGNRNDADLLVQQLASKLTITE
jgi:hydroxymethylbilane synthase